MRIAAVAWGLDRIRDVWIGLEPPCPEGDSAAEAVERFGMPAEAGLSGEGSDRLLLALSAAARRERLRIYPRPAVLARAVWVEAPGEQVPKTPAGFRGAARAEVGAD